MERQLEGMVIADRYEVRAHLATGGMATVFTAWDRRVDRPVAIKALRALDKTDRSTVDRFRREARAAASLVHPNAVTIYDFIEEQDEYFLVMEFVDGPNLKELLLRRGRLPYQEAVRIACQICSVLQVAHDRGFIHRDIKPQNILIAPDGQAKLTDFGIVRVIEAVGLTNTGVVLGTADYLAPEQARGEDLTPSSDLYSLGVVLYEMLCGHPPFAGPTAVAVAMQHARTPPPPLAPQVPDLPPAVEQVVFTALQKMPERRFHSARAMQQALEAALWLPLDVTGAMSQNVQPTLMMEPGPEIGTATMSGLSVRPARPSARTTERSWLGHMLLLLVVGAVAIALGAVLWVALSGHSSHGATLPQGSFTAITPTATHTPTPTPTPTLAPAPTPTELDDLLAQLEAERQELHGRSTALLSDQMAQLDSAARTAQATRSDEDIAAARSLATRVSVTAARLAFSLRMPFNLGTEIINTSGQIYQQLGSLRS